MAFGPPKAMKMDLRFPTSGANSAPDMGNPGSYTLRNEKQIPFGNDRKKGNDGLRNPYGSSALFVGTMPTSDDRAQR